MDQPGEGGIFKFTAEFEFLAVETQVIVATDVFKDIMIGVIGLNEYLSRIRTASGPAGDLGQELEGPFP